MNMNRQISLFSAEQANRGLDFITPMQRVLERHWYVLGEEVARFEEEFAAFLGVEHCVSVANGSDALELALRTLGVGSGDRVAVVANAGFYGSTATHAIGAQPIFVDVDDATLTMSPTALAAVLPTRPAAIIVTHLFGQMADIEQIVQMAATAGIPVIEDCAQSHGARRDGRRAGTLGDVACFSFYPTKNLGALGDGGAVVTNKRRFAEKVRQLRQYGWSQKYEVAIQGGRNSRLDELQAAVLRVKLPHLDSWNAQRRAIAQRYNAAFQHLDVRCPPSNGDESVAHLYVLRVKNRAALAAALKAESISTDIHYPIPDHRQPAYPQSEAPLLPITETACSEVISLPCFPGLPDESVQRVIAAVTAHFAR